MKEKQKELIDNSTGICYSDIVSCTDIEQLTLWFESLSMDIVGMENDIENKYFSVETEDNIRALNSKRQLLRIKQTLLSIIKNRMEFFHVLN